jgi:surface antigen
VGIARIAGCAAIAVALLSALAGTAQAHPQTGGYPFWSYDGPGSNPATYTWTNSSGYGFSPYGYAYRNCTDYAAWKLANANDFADYRGLGNASGWAGVAQARSYRVDHMPADGAVAWWGGELFHGFGHVAWVENVYVGSVEVAEYNHAGTGRFDTRRIPTRAPDAYIHFKDLPVRLHGGDFVTAAGEGGPYRLIGRAPIPVSHWSGFGGRHRVLLIDRGEFDRLRSYPANGTFITARGHPFRIAGGAPIAIGRWARVGGHRRALRVDAIALARAGGDGRWRHLRRHPRDGTVLRAGPGGPLYETRGGAPHRIAFRPDGRHPVVVDPVAIENAGEPGVWRFLRSP